MSRIGPHPSAQSTESSSSSTALSLATDRLQRRRLLTRKGKDRFCNRRGGFCNKKRFGNKAPVSLAFGRLNPFRPSETRFVQVVSSQILRNNRRLVIPCQMADRPAIWRCNSL